LTNETVRSIIEKASTKARAGAERAGRLRNEYGRGRIRRSGRHRKLALAAGASAWPAPPLWFRSRTSSCSTRPTPLLTRRNRWLEPSCDAQFGLRGRQPRPLFPLKRRQTHGWTLAGSYEAGYLRVAGQNYSKIPRSQGKYLPLKPASGTPSKIGVHNESNGAPRPHGFATPNPKGVDRHAMH